MDEQQNIIIYRTADGKASVALYAKDGKIWLNQQQMARIIMWYSTLCISYFFLQNIWNLTFFLYLCRCNPKNDRFAE